MNTNTNTNGSYFLNIHTLQTLPPSCANRDDTGSPKTAVYGGVNRGRISSQCLKKNIRDGFAGTLQDEVSVRTKEFNNFIKATYQRMFPDDEVKNLDTYIKNVIEMAGLKNALFPLSIKQVENLANVIHEKQDVLKGKEDKECKALISAALSKDHPADVVLFGRMLAGTIGKDVSVEACCQVAHAISTHTVSTQSDYYTAVDDFKDEAGAAMLGTLDYQSYTMYKFADVNVSELFEKSPELAPEILRQFLKLFITQVPSGKQNSYANVTYPSMLYVTLDRRNISLADAFEEPVCSENGYAKKSVQRFVECAKRKYETFLPVPIMSYGVDEFGVFDNNFVQITGHLDNVIDSIVNDMQELI